MWTLVAKVILEHRLKVVALVIIATLYMGYRAQEVKLQYEFKAMLPETDTTYLNYFEFRKMFGEETDVMIIGIKDSNLFEINKFKDLQATLKQLKSIDGVQHVVSVENAIELTKDTVNTKFLSTRIFPQNIETQEQLDSCVSKLHNLPLYAKILYEKEKHVYLIAVSLKKELMQSAEREPMFKNMTELTDSFAARNHLEIHYSGLPYTRTMMGILVKEEMISTSIYAALVTIFLLLFLFRSFRVVLISISVVTLASIWAMGTSAIFDYRLSVLSSMIPSLLIVIGVPNSIYLINRYHSEFLLHGNKIKALQRVITKVGQATFLTNLTTALGFATFIITSNSLLVEFGIVASINIIVLFFLSLTLLPIFFSYLSAPETKHTKHLENPFLKYVVRILEVVVSKYRIYVFLTTLLLIVLSINGMRYLHSTGYLLDDIPEDNKLNKDLHFFEDNINGVMPFEITIHTNTQKGATRLNNLAKIERLEDSLAKYPELTKFLSIADGYKFVRQSFYNGYPEFYTLPDQQELGFLSEYLSGETDKANMLNNMIDSSGQVIRVSGRVKDLGTLSMNELIRKVEADADSIFNPKKYDVKITGSSILFTQGTTYLIHNLYSSIGLAIFLIAFFMALIFRSVRMIFITLLPNLLPLLITAGIMGYFNIPVKISTVLVFSITFGIAVDSAIHFLAKYRQELHATNNNIEYSVFKALRETAPSIMYTALILFFGFSVFLLSDFGGTQALGLLIMITLFIAAFSNLFILPSVILELRKRLITKSFQATDDEMDIE